MSELIDRQSLLDNLNRFAPEKYNALVNGLIMKEPAVQPEIIRCKDCKFSHMTNDGRYCKYCDQFTDTDDYGELVEMYFDSDFYCGYAERRTDE